MVGPEIEAALSGMFSALVYSLLFYVKKRANKSSENFNPKKLAATLVVGGCIGLMYGYYGMPIDQPTISEMLVTYAGTIALVQSAIQAIYRQTKNLVSQK